ncbi:helix-turn-helix domain-containing protein [Methylobacterium longum]|uniref:Helix-turn-helix domain-containing protein n=1 Tax=Methylobacterium longum TaxID=767694 RepID=A0ABT8AK13_9HYPH|nr:helix-turn-helix domain-containing protein [Methylobacterium longum]MDN3569851.1 helix-turn-helix domain-containing protein [Methylobacterium longum]GJE13260.1 Transcriptional activator NphR [Methylobacterium longum]
MQKIFSTADVHPRDRFDYWMGTIRENIIRNDAVPACRRAFKAMLSAGSIGSVNLTLSSSSAVRVSHTTHHTGQPSDDQLFVFMPLAGSKVLQQSGRQTVLKPGQFAVIDPRLPHEAIFSDASETLTLISDRKLLESRLGAVQDLTARPIGLDTAEGQLASGYLKMLPSQAGRLSSAAADVVEVQLLDLVALALGKSREEHISCGSSARLLVRTKLYAVIDARLSDPKLDAAAIAKAAGVGVRYANAVLADENTSLGRLVQSRRLERCRTALADPAQGHRSVSEIAYRWGFSDMTHFGRRFRAAYGLLPSEFRCQARMEAP